MVELMINGLSVPVLASAELTQNYTPALSRYRFRTLGGTLKQQTQWSGKLATTIDARGLIPAGLQAIDYTVPVLLSCVGKRAITSASNIIDIPANRRTDTGAEPRGLAMVRDRWQRVSLNLVGDTATLGIMPGATQYQALYYPEITVYMDEPSEQSERGNAHGWTASAEEI